MRRRRRSSRRRRRGKRPYLELVAQPPEVPVAEALVPLQHAFDRGGFVGLVKRTGGRGPSRGVLPVSAPQAVVGLELGVGVGVRQDHR